MNRRQVTQEAVEELSKAGRKLFDEIVKALYVPQLYEFLKRKKLVWLVFLLKGMVIIGIFILFLFTIHSQ